MCITKTRCIVGRYNDDKAFFCVYFELHVDHHNTQHSPGHRPPTDGSDDHIRHHAYQLVVPL